MATMSDPLVLGVDLDGVCADYETAFRQAVAETRGVDPATLPAQTVLDSFSEWGMDLRDFDDAHRRAVTQQRIFRTMQPLPGVSEALWKLSDAGVWIRIITHRLCVNWAHEIAAADTAWWLDDRRIPYRDLCFIGDKPHVGADMYVDDSPGNIVALRDTGRPVLVFDQPYNRHLGGPRVGDWSGIVDYVMAELAARQRQIALPLDADTGLPTPER